MEAIDDDLRRFEAEGAPPLPEMAEGHVESDGARIWYRAAGRGAPVVLLHGGLGHGGNWGHQVPALVGSVIRAKPHGSAPAGYVASFIAVKQP